MKSQDIAGLTDTLMQTGDSKYVIASLLEEIAYQLAVQNEFRQKQEEHIIISSSPDVAVIPVEDIREFGYTNCDNPKCNKRWHYVISTVLRPDVAIEYDQLVYIAKIKGVEMVIPKPELKSREGVN